MNDGRPTMGSAYMEWAKCRSQARFNLATSGIANVARAEFPPSVFEELEITGQGGYGDAPLIERLATKTGAPNECVVQADGTSMANFLAIAACISPGDEVLIERPAYELLLNAADFLGARVRRFERRFAAGFVVDVDELRGSITAATRLVVLTNLHNPSGVLMPNDALREIGEIARAAGARVLVDEVYLDFARAARPKSAFEFGPQFVVTSSLTKVYGLSGLRCGWVLAEPELARRMWRLNDLMDASRVHVAERLSVTALDHLEQLTARTQKLLAHNRRLLDRFLDEQEENLDVVRPQFGTIVFPRLRRGNAQDFCRFLRERFETTVVPGEFFEMPRHFRLGIGGESRTLEAGLERLGAALQIFGR